LAGKRVRVPMSYRVLTARLKNVTSGAFFFAAANEGRVFSALCEAVAWASRGRRNDRALVLVEERVPQHRIGFRTAEDAARTVA
jgi:hypothetical protein